MSTTTTLTVVEMMEQFRLDDGGHSPLLPGSVSQYATKVVSDVCGSHQFTNPNKVLAAIDAMVKYHKHEYHNLQLPKIPKKSLWQCSSFVEAYNLRELVIEASAELDEEDFNEEDFNEEDSDEEDLDDRSVYSEDLAEGFGISDDEFLGEELITWKQVFHNNSIFQDLLDGIILVISSENDKAKYAQDVTWGEDAVACLQAYATFVRGYFRMTFLRRHLEGNKMGKDHDFDVLAEQLENEYQTHLSRFFVHIFLRGADASKIPRTLTKEQVGMLDAWLQRKFPELVYDAQEAEESAESDKVCWGDIYGWILDAEIPSTVETHIQFLESTVHSIPKGNCQGALEACKSIQTLYKLVENGYAVNADRKWKSACETIDSLMILERKILIARGQKPRQMLECQDGDDNHPELHRQNTYVRAMEAFVASNAATMVC